MLKKVIICPFCRAEFTPFGPFMLEKCYCPVCFKSFNILRGAKLILILYSVFAFSVLMTAYNIIRPQTSVIIALFWFISMLFLRGFTYLFHYILLITWSIWNKLIKR